MNNMDLCSLCETAIKPFGTLCEVCQTPIGFPNVRLALKEQDELERRYQLELASVKTRGLEDVAMKFEEAVGQAAVVIVRSVIDCISIVNNDNLLFSTFHQQVASGARMAESNQFDPIRTPIESLIHPFYFEKIHYAALSLENVGVKYYGTAHMKLNEKLIRNRATCFEENPFNLVKKLGLPMGHDFPPGYRSTWENKGKLALCKYHASLKSDVCKNQDFQAILLVDGDGKDADFIETHIYGNIHSKCIDTITLLPDVDVKSKILFEAHLKSFTAKNINIDIRTS